MKNPNVTSRGQSLEKITCSERPPPCQDDMLSDIWSLHICSACLYCMSLLHMFIAYIYSACSLHIYWLQIVISYLCCICVLHIFIPFLVGNASKKKQLSHKGWPLCIRGSYQKEIASKPIRNIWTCCKMIPGSGVWIGKPRLKNEEIR